MCTIYVDAWYYSFRCIFSSQEGAWVLPICSVLFLEGLWNHTVLGSFFLSSFLWYLHFTSLVNIFAVLQIVTSLSFFFLSLKGRLFLLQCVLFCSWSYYYISWLFLPCNGSMHFFYANGISVNSKSFKVYLPHTLAWSK